MVTKGTRREARDPAISPSPRRGGGGGGSEMKARPMDTAGGTPGHTGRSGPASFSGPSSRMKTDDAAGAGPLVSGAPGAALLAAAALLLAPGDARAIQECGAASLNAVVTCSGASYPDGIFYGGGDTGRWLQGNNRINVPGSAGATTTITATTDGTSTQSVGVYGRGGTGSNDWAHIIIGGETDGTPHVVNIVQGTSTNTDTDRNNGVYFRTDVQSVNNSAATTIELRRGVTIGSATDPMKQNGLWVVLGGSGGRGSGPATITSAAPIFAAKRGILFARNVSNITGATTITNSGDISSGEEGIYLWYSRVVAPWVSAPLSTLNTFTGGATITNTGAIRVSGADKYGIVMNYRGIGAAEVDNEGTIDAPLGSGIHLVHANGDGRLTNNGAATLTNRGAVSAATLGLRLEKHSGAGATTLTNSGDVRVTADAAAGAGHAIWLTESGSGTVMLTNSGDLRSENHAIYAETSAANTAALTLTNSGAVASEDGDGIRLERGAEGDVTVTNGGTSTTSGNVSGRWHGVYIGKAARIDFDQTAGTISGRTGVYAEVTRENAVGDTRSTDSDGNHVPAIDVDWTGGTIARGTAENDGRFRAASATQALAFDQEAAAVKAVEGTVRWGSAAGIEAHALSWRDVAAQVAKGDDPGAFADNAAQMTAVPATATATNNDYIAQFKAALRNGDLTVSPAVLTAIGTTATTAATDLTDAQIVAYLRTDNGATRTLLRNVLAQGLSDKEKAVLRAVAAGDSTALTTALDDTAAAFSSSYKTAVRALLDRYNLDDVRVTMTAGSIASRGDGIRAYYATVNDNNGGINVTVGQGASVTGDVNGILVSGSGTTSTGTKNQAVTVAGTVMGGTGAGVHLIGGGEVTVNAGGVVGATSGTAITTSGGGDLTADISGRVEGDIRAAGALTLTAPMGSVITGTVHNPTSTFNTVAGTIGRLLYTNGGAVTVASTGTITGVEGQGIISSAGALSVAIADGSTVGGDIQAKGTGGALTFAAEAGSVITGTVYDPTSAFTTVAGSIGRLLYTTGNGATVTVAPNGRLTGVEGQAIISNDGALSVTVAGGSTVGGDISAGEGELTLMAEERSVITGTVYDPVGPLTVAGSIGRLLYSNGGAVTVVSTGVLTGVAGEALISEAGALSVAIAGGSTVGGDIQAKGTDGALTFAAEAESVITGTVHDPVGPLTVAGSIGRLLYSNGGAVTVVSTGVLTGVAGEALISEAGALSVAIAGGSTVGGDIQAKGTDGALTFAAEAESVITGTVHDPIGPLTVVGSIGRLLYTNGAVVTVAAGGQLTGVDGDGGREALRSEAGDLSVVVAGGTTVGGDIRGLGDGEHVVTVQERGTVTGLVHLGGSTVTVGGTVGGIFLENGGMVMVGERGMVTGSPVGRPGVYGVRLGNGGTIENRIENRGTIEGKIGIIVDPGMDSTVVNYDTGKIHSTDGMAGAAIRYGEGDHTLTLHSRDLEGEIQGLNDKNDTVDMSRLDADALLNNPIDIENANAITIILPPGSTPPPGRSGPQCGIKACADVDISAFALTDDMLSDLTGGIHGAVVDTETGLRRGDPAGGRVVWATPFGGARDQNGSGIVADATHYFGGGMLGMSWGAKDVRVGGFIGGSVGQLAVGKDQRGLDLDVDVQTLFFGLAASRAFGNVLYDARLLVGSLTQDSTRRLVMDTADGKYSSVFFSPEVGVATTMNVTDTLAARPRLRVRYAGLFTEGFRERGQMRQGWDVQFAERTLHVVEARAEVGIPFALATGGRITPRVGVEGRWLLSGSEIGLGMAGGEMVSRDVGGDDGVITGTAGFGMTLPVAEATTLVGNFDGALTTEEAWRATGYLGLTYSF